MNDNEFQDGVVEAVQTLLEAQVESGRGMSGFQEAIRQLGTELKLPWLVDGSKDQFAAKCQFLFQAYSDDHYGTQRRKHLMDEGFPLWVFRAEEDCPDDHLDLDGLVLPPEHSFWNAGYPPLDPGCGCYVVGASSDKGAARLGGKPDMPPPQELAYAPRGSDVAMLLNLIRSGNAPIDTGI